MSFRKTVARVFCQLKGGGNPVTVFATKSAIPPEMRVELARSCDWESVMVEESSMSFFMPTGEEVSFCAHAAMAGVHELAQQTEQLISFSVPAQDSTYTATRHENSIVSLEMTAKYEESTIGHPPALHRLLRECHRVSKTSFQQKGTSYPTFCNVSVARPKTLVYVNSTEALNEARPPPTDTDNYKLSCDALETTGLYLYSHREGEEGSFNCRQFPRASGYAEDPATGIAAAALAISLRNHNIVFDAYKCYQGEAMGRPSLILVDDIVKQDSSRYSFRLMGRVEVDSSDELEL